MKVILEFPRPFPHMPDNHRVVPVTSCLPFYWGRACIVLHRVRSARMFFSNGVYTHTGFHFWCGNIGGSHKGRITDNPPDGVPICATCEGRAIGAGQLGAREIAGRPVLYVPRLTAAERAAMLEAKRAKAV